MIPSRRPLLRRLPAYLWALPVTLLGLLFVPIAGVRGEVRRVGGVLELHGPAVAWILRHLIPVRGGAAALTLGHVVLGRSAAALDRTRAHERVHVRQVERWGLFFFPAYLAGSLYALLRGGDPYRDNPFEQEAFSTADARKRPAGRRRPL